MPRFKVGDKAKVVYVRSRGNVGWYPGVVVTIDCVEGGFSPNTKHPYDYVARKDGLSRSVYVLDEQLEPIVDLGSWDELEKSIRWNPSKQREIVE